MQAPAIKSPQMVAAFCGTAGSIDIVNLFINLKTFIDLMFIRSSVRLIRRLFLRKSTMGHLPIRSSF